MKYRLKEGMYVRTKDGIIGKYNVVKEWIDVPTVNGYYEIKEIEREYIDNKLYRNYVVVNASHSIIDLIELGDYVNGEKITRVIPQDICGDEVLDYQHIFVNNKEIFKHEINSIVTKEQFERIEILRGEDNEKVNL